MKKHCAIVLAAGRGSRMKSDVPKQFLELAGKPLVYYSLKAFEESFVDEIVLVTGEDAIGYCRESIVKQYGFTKVKAVVAGGAERYDSVYNGICALEDADYIYIHDGARPMLDAGILNRAKECVERYHACAAGMPVKDTIKIVDKDNQVVSTPERKYVWQIQTPQVFDADLIRSAYQGIYELENRSGITDDAMVVETIMGSPVKLFLGDYCNIKVTTPEDLPIAETILNEK